jgi:hypothetical protein
MIKYVGLPIKIMRDRLMVGHRPLEASIGVRIPVPQQVY